MKCRLQWRQTRLAGFRERLDVKQALSRSEESKRNFFERHDAVQQSFPSDGARGAVGLGTKDLIERLESFRIWRMGAELSWFESLKIF